ncbi:MAG: methylenetetrahydrofolate reductase [NAD(P)H] [Gammaproteobacteria bacterium]|nr:methylenetetrahydrofolate reductase [NAD(P)H] [Gammaproteobacteria bacterium]
MHLSFEFFPPKTGEGLQNVLSVAEQLSVFSPEYFSVTHGAGGSVQDFTMSTIAALQKRGDQVAPHVSCIGAKKESIRSLLQHYQDHGIQRIFALRGDLPSGMGSSSREFHYARDLVAFIRDTTGDAFHISVAVYPECHPQATSMVTDLQHFKEKVEAGASSAITQYFYHPEAYAQLLADCHRLKIELPITPGIMPIYHFSQLCRFSEMCGAEIPRYIRKRMESYGDDVASVQAFGIEVVSRLCQDLLKAGAPGLHFYTLNKSNIVSQILQNLSIGS